MSLISSIASTGKSGKIKKQTQTNKKTARNIFIFCIVTIPILNFLLTYVVVNINSIVLAFQRYDIRTGQYYFNGIKNFSRLFNDMSTDPILIQSTRNAITAYLVGLLFGTPTSILAAYYIHKKIPFSGFFVIMLFLPSIISSIVFVLIFKYFIEYALPQLLNDYGMASLLIRPDTSFLMMILYWQWLGFAGGLILYTGAMNRIPISLREYAMLEGCNNIKELWYITLPLIFPTLTVFLTLSVAGFFTNSLSLYAFYGADAPYSAQTLGYYFFTKVFGARSSLSEYTYASAAGISFTLIAAPITYLVKYLLEHFGPTAEY